MNGAQLFCEPCSIDDRATRLDWKTLENSGNLPGVTK